MKIDTTKGSVYGLCEYKLSDNQKVKAFSGEKSFEKAVNRKFSLIGAELEFYFKKEYDKEYNGTKTKSEFDIFGYDCGVSGGNTKELRTPVFQGISLEKTYQRLIKYLLECQRYLHNRFDSTFVPYIKSIDNIPLYIPMGFHFSVSIETFNSDQLKMIDERSVIIANKLEDIWNPQYIQSFKCRSKTYSHLPTCSNWKRSNNKRIEYRFFPSCAIESLEPYLQYIFFGGNMPVSYINPLLSEKSKYELS